MTESGSRTIRVLIVEDAMDQAMLLRAMLTSTELYEVAWAQDGDRALSMFADAEFDVVLTDLNLPGLDGFDLTREIKRTSKTPVVAITGYTHQSYIESAYRAGADGLINKPFDRDELLNKLRELLPDLHPRESEGLKVIAIGALAGDIEAGCGGTLAQFQAAGAEVMVFLVHPGSPQEAACARAAAETMGARVLAGPDIPLQDDAAAAERQLLMERVIREFNPQFAFVPSLGDDTPDRREAHRLCRVAAEGVPNVMAYMTGTTTLEFRPTVFRRIGPVLGRKLEVMKALAPIAKARPDLASDFVRANAHYWGRFAAFGLAEPFEVLRGDSPQ